MTIRKLKPAESLEVADLLSDPVWRFVNNDALGETLVTPIKRLPVDNLSGKLVGTEVQLSNGNREWALLGNIETDNARLSQQFLSVGLHRDRRWFWLARYFDVDYPRNGPLALAAFLGLSVDEVFPISYDLRRYAKGDPAALVGVVDKEPREKLTREQIITLAVPKR